MPLYFFHIRSARGLERDEIGVELADLQAVQAEAALTVVGFERDADITGQRLPGRAFEVMDAQGTYLLTIPFGFASLSPTDDNEALMRVQALERRLRPRVASGDAGT